MVKKSEAVMLQQMGNIHVTPGAEIVNDNYLVTATKKYVDHVGANKSGTTSY
jgi:hypothetical protein